MNLRSPNFVAATLAIFAAVVLFTSFRFYQSARAQSQAAADGLDECRRLAADMARLRTAPRVASLDVEPPDRLAARVTQAATTAELIPEAVVSVDPQSPVRIGRTAYAMRTTQIALQDASLAQIAQFAEALQDKSQGLVVRDIVLDARPLSDSDAEERWDVRLVLTQMIYSPISPG